MDPHYVQEADQNVKDHSESYFCESFRKCKKTAIDSSVGICFYFRNIKDLNIFYTQIQQLKKENNENFFIFVSDETPNYVKAA